MRIWSLHPKYLDTKGLLALWRESLLAKKVLDGKTKGYKNHPQLNRFKKTESPIKYLNFYLTGVHHESLARGYNFDKKKIGEIGGATKIHVTKGQVMYEFHHLLSKLKVRDLIKFNELVKINNIDDIEVHPLFLKTDGLVEEWEKIMKN